MRVECNTDIGTVRTSNQDSCQCGALPGGGAWALVCDGMGGANGGNVASAVAVEKISKVFLDDFSAGMDPEKIKELMINAITRGNDAVYAMSLEKEELRGMGTTAVLLVADRDLLHVVHVGDSRGYLKSAQGLTQITVDHSYVQDLVNIGQLTAEQARVHPQRNIITRVLGVYDQVQSDYSRFPFGSGDMALACSDGLTNYVDDSLLLQYMETYGGNEWELTEKLIRLAVDSGGSDNVTVAVITNG